MPAAIQLSEAATRALDLVFRNPAVLEGADKALRARIAELDAQVNAAARAALVGDDKARNHALITLGRYQEAVLLAEVLQRWIKPE